MSLLANKLVSKGDLFVALFVDKFEPLQPIPLHANSDFAVDEAVLVVSSSRLLDIDSINDDSSLGRLLGFVGNVGSSADTDLCFKSNNFS